MDWQNIEVSSKIVGHISAGIYRSPAGALKELVSNAFDADATRVAITTNWPSFDIITCRDNGSGMTRETFERIMRQGIGDSTKRATTEGKVSHVTTLGRPIVGWLGIGMLGIAQICHEFQVISHHKASQTAFRATIRLVDFLREKVSEVSPEPVPATSTGNSSAEKPIDVGLFSIEPVAYEPDKAGTYVIAADMRSAFVRKFRETSGKDRLPSIFSAFLKKIHTNRSAKTVSPYWQMVWDLAVACPLPYVETGPFDWDKIVATQELKERLIHQQQALKTHQFEVVVDGLSLRRPHRYPLASQPSESGKLTGRLFAVDKNVKVYGQNFRISGYVYLQDGRAIEPMDLRGLLVRIRNVAIGTYDATLFSYPRIPNPRFNWISGEVDVEGGLEFALNIDRASFNEIHPHFVKLKEVIHNLLETEVFPEAGHRGRERSLAKRKGRATEKQALLNTFIHRELGDDYVLISTDESSLPLMVDPSGEKVLENNQSKFLPTPKSKRELMQLIAYAFEISMQAPEEKRREKFYGLLSEFVKSGLL